MFRVFKSSAGDYRWVGVSSSAFEDRTGETVATKAVDYSIKAANGDYGELRIYHLPGTRVGTCDSSMRIGMFLIESGTFDDADMAVQVRSTVNANPEKYGLSIGFKYRPDDLADNCYEKIRIFERSIVEEQDTAALFTNIRLMSNLTEVTMDKKEELVGKLTEMLDGNGNLAQSLLEQATKIGIKMQAGENLAFKEGEETKVTTEAVTEPVAKAVTEAVIEPVIEPVTEAVAKPTEEVVKAVKEPEESTEDVTMKDFVLELDLPTIETLAQEVAQRIPDKQAAVEDMQKQLKSMATQLDSVGAILNHLLKTDEDKLIDMQKQLPRARLTYRPSSESETITESPEETVAEKQVSTEDPINQSLADSIQRIQAHRSNLRIVA